MIEIERLSNKEEQEEIEKETHKLQEKVGTLELRFTLNGKDDKKDAILTIHPGAGGTESCDWAQMLFRMYTRWMENKGFKFKVLNYEVGDVAGLKDTIIEVRGEYVYGYLKTESGIHRLVRISPFDANKKRHTSFASVFVYPAPDEQTPIDINESDLKLQTFRSSGPGGQNVNKLSTAVRITHIPTGTVATCQSERSQYQNRENAMRILMAKLYLQREQEQEKEKAKLEEKKTEIGWAREIRSYVFEPYTLVKDHRTRQETSNVQKVMDGDIDPFIRAYLLSPIK